VSTFFIYIIFPVIVFFIIVLFFAKPTWTNDDDMAPFITDNGIILVDNVRFRYSTINRKDIVTYKGKDGKKHLGRVIGLPKERIRMANYKILIDEKPLDEPYASVVDLDGAEPYQFHDEFIIPDKKYIVLPDKRPRDIEFNPISQSDMTNRFLIKIF
jgi:signal peptidase I